MKVKQKLADVADGSLSIYKILVTGLLIFELVRFRIFGGRK